MSMSPLISHRDVRKITIQIHRWLSVGAALFWMIQAITGTLLSFHFELEDVFVSTQHQRTNLEAIEDTIDEIAAAGPDAQVYWIWTSAGLPDRYVILASGDEEVLRRIRIDGAGDIQRDRAAHEHSFLGLMRQIHLSLLSGAVGHWILAVSGVLLVTNLLIGLKVAWPKRGMWRRALVPVTIGHGSVRIYSWHRALGLWAIVPALLIAATGALLMFEHEIGDALDAEDATLPALPRRGDGVGFAAAVQAAVAAIPGSRFVGTTIPTEDDASYYAWVRAPGELYRGGYGGSLVIINANDGSVRGAYPATELNARAAFVKSLYPLHTGEFAGLAGRIVAMAVGVWLAVMIVLGGLLWLKRRKLKRG